VANEDGKWGPNVLTDVMAPLELERMAMGRYLAIGDSPDAETYQMLSGCVRVIEHALVDLQDVHNYIVDESEPKASGAGGVR
jgi:hypothetical protein